jgi:hypothetical protein
MILADDEKTMLNGERGVACAGSGGKGSVHEIDLGTLRKSLAANVDE